MSDEKYEPIPPPDQIAVVTALIDIQIVLQKILDRLNEFDATGDNR